MSDYVLKVDNNCAWIFRRFDDERITKTLEVKMIKLLGNLKSNVTSKIG
jgi:hypothetical protein